MRFSKAWCGLFSVIGSGLGGAYYLASKGSAAIEKATSSFINDLLSKNLTMHNITTTIHTDYFPEPLSASIDLKFRLKQILDENIMKTIEELPPMLSEATQALVWEQAIMILLVIAGVSGLGIYIQGKLKESKSPHVKPELDSLLDTKNLQEQASDEIPDLEKQALRLTY